MTAEWNTDAALLRSATTEEVDAKKAREADKKLKVPLALQGRKAGSAYDDDEGRRGGKGEAERPRKCEWGGAVEREGGRGMSW